MLDRLTIKNVALIDSAEIEFGEGLNVLSGETGAGGVEHGAAQSSGTALCGSSRGNDGRRPCAFDG